MPFIPKSGMEVIDRAVVALRASTTAEIPDTDLYGLMRTWLVRSGISLELST